MKCKHCSCAIKGYFNHLKEEYVCTGVKEPFVISDYENAECTEYKSWYTKTDLSSIVRISESDNFVVDYDKSRGMYRVSVFDDGHFWDEFWFDAYEDKETKEFPMDIKRFEKPMAVREDAWWCGYCPKCGIMLSFNYADPNRDNRKQYCWHCGQLVDFELKSTKV